MSCLAPTVPDSGLNIQCVLIVIIINDRIEKYWLRTPETKFSAQGYYICPKETETVSKRQGQEIENRGKEEGDREGAGV